MVGRAKLRAIAFLGSVALPTFCFGQCLDYVDRYTTAGVAQEALRCWKAEKMKLQEDLADLSSLRAQNETLKGKVDEFTRDTQSLRGQLDASRTEVATLRKATESPRDSTDLASAKAELSSLRIKYDRAVADLKSAKDEDKLQQQFQSHEIVTVKGALSSSNLSHIKAVDAKAQFVDSKLVLTQLFVTVDESDAKFPKLDADNQYEIRVWSSALDETKNSYYGVQGGVQTICCFTKAGKVMKLNPTNPVRVDLVPGVRVANQDLVFAVVKKGETNYKGVGMTLKDLVPH